MRGKWVPKVRWILSLPMAIGIGSIAMHSRITVDYIPTFHCDTTAATSPLSSTDPSLCLANPLQSPLLDIPHPQDSLAPAPLQAHQSQVHRPVRILLGIASLIDDFTERQRRHIIRNTYLDFDRLHRPDQPNRVCSLQNYLAQELPHCQLIYTFLLGPKDGRLTNLDRGIELPLSMFDNHELDVVYFNVEEQDPVGKRWAWFRASSQWMNDTDIPLAAYTDSHLLILPTAFWNKNPLFSSHTPPWNTTTTTAIYGGLPTLKTECPPKKCSTLQRHTVMRRFVLLSQDLVHYLSSYTIPESLSSSSNKEAPDVVIANALHNYSGPIQDVALNGLIAKTSQHDQIGDYVALFDRYKDNLVNYTNNSPEMVIPISSNHSDSASPQQDRWPRLFLGIFSMDTPKELERRQMIRETYLQAFVNTDTPHRICSVAELESLHSPTKNPCQLVYAFIVGGNPDGPKERVIDIPPTEPIALPDHLLPNSVRLLDHAKGDIVYLNIQENGKEGKSQTFFKFATTLLDKHYFDYLAKTDSDTVLYPQPLLQVVINRLPIFPHNWRVYGGDYRIKPSSQQINLGPVYMGGHFYFMSPDLAQYITSSACNRTALSVYSEDQSIGNFIHSLPEPIRRIRIRADFFDHPVKKVERMKSMWNKRGRHNG